MLRWNLSYYEVLIINDDRESFYTYIKEGLKIWNYQRNCFADRLIDFFYVKDQLHVFSALRQTSTVIMKVYESWVQHDKSLSLRLFFTFVFSQWSFFSKFFILFNRRRCFYLFACILFLSPSHFSRSHCVRPTQLSVAFIVNYSDEYVSTFLMINVHCKRVKEKCTRKLVYTCST